ncbi:MAG TPA: transglycosylase SLT domain-containing protein [archaeon]|nr:transglycosylase SLT domain-containing protein [archaeon]
MRAFLGLAIVASLLAQSVQGSDGETSQAKGQLVAAFQLPQVPGLSGPSADWQQWDSFFTFVVKRFGQDVPEGLKDSLGDAFLDSRYELTSAIAPGQGGNPVPELFLNGWQRLSPLMNQALPGMPAQTASHYSNFISAADKLAVLGKQGAQVGLLQLTPDALRGMARLIEPGAPADPLAYSTNVDADLRSLLGLGSPLAASGGGHSQLNRLRLPEVGVASVLSAWLIPEVGAAEAPAANQWVPDEKQLPAYLMRVRSLLVASSDRAAAKNKLADRYKPLYRQIVFAAAWQETCWRQFVKRGKNVTPMTSATGDLGLMQVNRHTWRGVYDLTGLGDDIAYNGNAGSEILLYYLARHAIRKGEDKHEGGNLARGTYSAYNGGPGQLGRYRAAQVNPALRKVDQAFWEKFQTVSSGREMEVVRCYKK